MQAPHTQAAALSNAPRLDLYAPIHKALRAWMFDTVQQVGRTDGQCPDTALRTLRQVESLLAVCDGHIHHENTFLHPVLERGMPGTARDADVAHQEHGRHMARLRTLVTQARGSQGPAAFGAFLALYRELALFVADNLAHMHWEETVHNEALWARHSDAELAQVHDALVQSIPSAEMAETLRHMLPALTPVERLGMLQDMRGKMPPGAFDGVLQLAHLCMQPQDVAALMAGLGLGLSLPPGRA